MGEANYMVSILYSDEVYPKAYFFKLQELAHQFYDSMCAVHDDATVQLWTLNISTASWSLTSFN